MLDQRDLFKRAISSYNVSCYFTHDVGWRISFSERREGLPNFVRETYDHLSTTEMLDVLFADLYCRWEL